MLDGWVHVRGSAQWEEECSGGEGLPGGGLLGGGGGVAQGGIVQGGAQGVLRRGFSGGGVFRW